MADRPRDITEVRFTVETNFLRTLQGRLGVEGAVDICRPALTLLAWASREVQRGRVILSATKSGKDVHRLAMPELARPSGAGRASLSSCGKSLGALGCAVR